MLQSDPCGSSSGSVCTEQVARSGPGHAFCSFSCVPRLVEIQIHSDCPVCPCGSSAGLIPAALLRIVQRSRTQGSGLAPRLLGRLLRNLTDLPDRKFALILSLGFPLLTFKPLLLVSPLWATQSNSSLSPYNVNTSRNKSLHSCSAYTV